MSTDRQVLSMCHRIMLYLMSKAIRSGFLGGLAAICLGWGAVLLMPATALAQTNYYATNGVEYSVVGSLPGDQVWPDAALAANGGYLVWQDNITDGSGWGVSACRLDTTLSG